MGVHFRFSAIEDKNRGTSVSSNPLPHLHEEITPPKTSYLLSLSTTVLLDIRIGFRDLE
jgi:hypothetical protein